MRVAAAVAGDDASKLVIVAVSVLVVTEEFALVTSSWVVEIWSLCPSSSLGL